LTNNQLQLVDVDRKECIADILNWLDICVQPDEPAIIAVDAPTLIPNATGSRLPDKLSHKHFGKYHAGCYPANLNLPFADRTLNFGLQLESRGFTHAPTIKPQKLGRYQIEVFPHPAIVHLFNLERILKYKKGRIRDRYLELLKLHNYILHILPSLEPPLRCLRFCGSFPSEIPTTGAALKAVEDKLAEPHLRLCRCTLVVLGRTTQPSIRRSHYWLHCYPCEKVKVIYFYLLLSIVPKEST
jgi:predicted RNase H-like nuclease